MACKTRTVISDAAAPSPKRHRYLHEFLEVRFCLCRDAVAHLFEAWMPSYAPQMVLLTFVETKVRPAAGNGKAN